MRARLIHNPSAGDERHAAPELVAALEVAGYDVRHSPAEPTAAQIAEWLREPVDLVVAAGGDGTVGRTARAVRGRGIPMAIAPLGTANNVAWTLGLQGDAASLLRRLGDPVRRRLDLGVAVGSWGESRFIEAAGVGLFQRVMKEEAAFEDAPTEEARRLLLWHLARLRSPCAWELSLDGRTVADELVLVEVMNIRSIGPHLRFAPTADPFDGLLDVVIVRHRDRARLTRYLRALVEGDEGATPDLETERARHVGIRLDGTSVRVDDDVLPASGVAPPQNGELRVVPGAVELWLPSER